jgi:hypothetical protein
LCRDFAEYLFEWDNTTCNLREAPFLGTEAKYTKMLGVLLVLINKSQSMRKLLATPVPPSSAADILALAFPKIEETPLQVQDLLTCPKKQKFVRQVTPKLIANVSYMAMHSLFPSKKAGAPIEVECRKRTAVSDR